MNPIAFALSLALLPCTPAVSDDDLIRFPGEAVAIAYCRMAYDHREHLRRWSAQRTHLYPDEYTYWHERCLDQHQRWDIWDDLRLARKYARERGGPVPLYYDTCGPEEGRHRWRADCWKWEKEALQRLREKIGPVAYGMGVMPCAVAVELYEIVD